MMGDLIIPQEVTLGKADLEILKDTQDRRQEQWSLLPVETCRAILPTIEAALTPATEEQARKNAEILIGSYPRHMIDEPQIYSRAIISVFQRFPAWIGAKAVDEITLQNEWPPSRAVVHATCNKLANDVKRTQSVISRMILETKRREDAADEEKNREIAREEFRQKYGEKTPLEVLADEGISIGADTNRK